VCLFPHWDQGATNIDWVADANLDALLWFAIAGRWERIKCIEAHQYLDLVAMFDDEMEYTQIVRPSNTPEIVHGRHLSVAE